MVFGWDNRKKLWIASLGLQNHFLLHMEKQGDLQYPVLKIDLNSYNLQIAGGSNNPLQWLRHRLAG